MITSAEKASESVGSKLFASESSSRAYLSKSRVVARKMFASGRPSPNSTLPSPSMSALAPFAARSSLVP